MNNGALAFAGGPVQAESVSRFERILFTTDFSETSLNALPALALWRAPLAAVLP